MPRPRKSQIAVEATPYYHCVSRCVRRAFLCGEDRYTGRSYDHRRAFIEEELLRLGQVFYLDVVAYAVMSNHYHVVLYIDQEAQKSADAKDILGITKDWRFRQDSIHSTSEMKTSLAGTPIKNQGSRA